MPEERRVSIEQAGKLVNLLGAIKRLRGVPTEGEVTEREKFTFEKQKFVIQEQRQRRQFRLTKWKEYLDGLDEGPSKEHARKMLQGDYEAMPPYEQQVLKPYFQRLLNPLEEKKALYLKTVKPPKWNDYDPEKQKALFAGDLFAQDDYNFGLKRFMGVEAERKKVIPISEDVWAYRDEEGKTGLLSRENFTTSEAIKTILDNNNTTLDVALTQGGKVDTGKGKSVVDGKMRYELTPTFNILTGKKGFRKIEVGRVAKEGQRVLPEELLNFSDGFSVGEGDAETVGGKLFNILSDRLDAMETVEVPVKGKFITTPTGEKEQVYKTVKVSELGMKDQVRLQKKMIREMLGARMMGWNVEIHDPGTFARTWGADYFAEGPSQNLVFVPGIPIPFYNEAEEMVGAFYYDADYDVVYDTYGVARGTKAEIQARAAAVPKGGKLRW